MSTKTFFLILTLFVFSIAKTYSQQPHEQLIFCENFQKRPLITQLTTPVNGGLNIINKNIINDSCSIPLANFPLIESFEQELSSCWTYFSENAENAADFGRRKNDVPDGGFCWQFNAYNNVPFGKNHQYLISPKLPVDKHKGFKFKSYILADYMEEKIRVGYSTTDNLVSSFIWIDTIFPEDDWLTYWYHGYNIPKDACYIALDYISAERKFTYIDALSILVYEDFTVKDLDAVEIIRDSYIKKSLQTEESISVKIRNNGGMPVNSDNGKKCYIYIAIDDTVRAKDTLTFSNYYYSMFFMGDIKYHTFNKNFDLSIYDTANIKVWVDWSEDNVRSNDTAYLQIVNERCNEYTVSEYPVVQNFDDGGTVPSCWEFVSSNAYNAQFMGYEEVGLEGTFLGNYYWTFYNKSGSRNANNYYVITPHLSTDKTKEISFLFLTYDNILPFYIGYSTTNSNDTGSFIWAEKKDLERSHSVNPSISSYTSPLMPATAKYIAIKYVPDWLDYNDYRMIFLDSVVVRGYAENTTDLSVKKFTGIDTIINSSIRERQLSVLLKSNYYDTAHNYSVFLQMNDREPIEEISTVAIAPYDTVTYIFSTPVDLSEQHINNIKVWVRIANDYNHDNDTVNIKVINNACNSFCYHNEMSVVSVTHPTGRQQSLTSSEPITVSLCNNGRDTAKIYELYISVNGSTPISEIVTEKIPPQSIVSYTTTSALADLLAIDTYNIMVWVKIDGDIVTSNDTAKTVVYNMLTVANEKSVTNFNIKVYPNPTDGELTVSVNKDVLLEIVDIKGTVIKRVWTNGRRKYFLPPASLYILRFTDKKGNTLTKQVIVK